MDAVHADLQRLMNEDLVSDLQKTDLTRLRAIRTEMTAAEGDISFVRRVAQGRLDIVGHESARRQAGADPGSSTGEVAEQVPGLLYDMPDILAEVTGRGDRRAPVGDAEPVEGAGTGVPQRKVQVGEPGAIASSLLEELDEAGPSSEFSDLPNMAVGDLADLMDRLQMFERNLSEVRRALHDRIDSIQEEIGRRYRDGEVSVDSVLNNMA